MNLIDRIESDWGVPPRRGESPPSPNLIDRIEREIEALISIDRMLFNQNLIDRIERRWGLRVPWSVGGL